MDDKLRSLYRLWEAKTWHDFEIMSELEKEMIKEEQSKECEEIARCPEF